MTINIKTQLIFDKNHLMHYMKHNSNQLELLSDEQALFRLNDADLAVICVVRNEMERLRTILEERAGGGRGQEDPGVRDYAVRPDLHDKERI